MNRSILAIAFAFALSGGVAAVAHADEATSVSPQLSEQSAAMPSPSQTLQSNAALQDYRENVNPNVNIPTTGIYDQADRFEGPTGRPLPGWGSVNGEGAGDN
jgi:hypothetical protein